MGVGIYASDTNRFEPKDEDRDWLGWTYSSRAYVINDLGLKDHADLNDEDYTDIVVWDPREILQALSQKEEFVAMFPYFAADAAGLEIPASAEEPYEMWRYWSLWKLALMAEHEGVYIESS